MDLLLKTITTFSGLLGSAPASAQSKVSSIRWTELSADAQRFFARVANNGTTFVAMRWNDLPQTTRDWIRAHPYQTAFYVANGIVVVAPTPVTAPLLGAAGLATAGPAAGSVAAAIQTALTSVGAGSIALKSAATGGHGIAAVADGMQAAMAIGSGVYGLWVYFSGGKKDGAANAAPGAAVEERCGAAVGNSKDQKKSKVGRDTWRAKADLSVISKLLEPTQEERVLIAQRVLSASSVSKI